MADDPREVLKAAGVECVEVDELWNDLAPYWCPDCHEEHEREYSELNRRIAGDAVDAILALAQLVAKYKWQREIQVVGCLDYNGAIARLDQYWETHVAELELD